MTREEALTAATQLLQAYPRDVAEGTLESYALNLADLEKTATLEAIRRLIRTSKWLPTIAEIFEAVAQTTLPRAVDAASAWSEAVGLMSAIGSYRTLGAAGSPYVNRTLRLCGRWDEICQEDATWLRKRFIEIYAGVVREARESMQVNGTFPAWLEGPTRPSITGQVQALLDGLSQSTTVPR